jgi:hypothetical protein
MNAKFEISLRAIRRFHQLVDEVPGMWRPERKSDWCMRFWAVDNDGRVQRIQRFALEGLGDRLFKDSIAVSASAWCAKYKPAAVVFASEAYCISFETDEGYRRMFRHEGRTPDLMDPDNRERVVRLYGARLSEMLIVSGEAHTLDPVAFRYPICGESLGPREVLKMTEFRFAGVLGGGLAAHRGFEAGSDF